MKTLVLDCETIAPLGIECELAEMGEKRHGGMDAQKFGALCPALAQLVAVGIWCWDDVGNEIREAGWTGAAPRVLVATDAFPSVACPILDQVETEALLVERLMKALRAVQGIVTFNGAAFDLPLLWFACKRLGIEPAPILLHSLSQKPWERFPHADVSDALRFGGRDRWSLRAYSMGMLGEDPKAGGDGEGVAAMVAAGDAAGIATYCAGDVRSTGLLWRIWAEGA